MTPIQSSTINETVVSVADKTKKYGRYTITGLLGKGSMGDVFRAHDPRIDRQIALKVLKKDHVTSQKYVQRFTKEAKAIGRLSHPNIVAVHDVGQDHGTVYIAMELIEGQPLDQLVKSRKFDFIEVLNMGIQVATALDYAHQKGVVHRDIKPSNLIMIDGGHIKLTDFGIAHLEDTSATQQTRAGDILGTPAFMSPEQLEGKTIDRRSDLFSLGIILYKLTVGEWPFSGKSMAALFNAISNSQPKKPKKVNPAIPPVLSALIMKSLEKNPDHRFQTGKEMASALQTCLDSISKYSKNQFRMYMAYGIILVICLFGSGGWLLSRYFSANPQPVSTEHQTLKRHMISENSERSRVPIGDSNLEPSDLQVVKAVVSINSDPSNAEIYIDNQLKGTTPINLNLPMGTYELRLDLPQHYETKVLIEVSSPDSMPLKFRLTPI